MYFIFKHELFTKFVFYGFLHHLTTLTVYNNYNCLFADQNFRIYDIPPLD